MLGALETFSVAFIAALHLSFLILEMFFWDKPLGQKIFGLDKAFAKQTKTLAANQGLYNGFLCAGLLWSFFIDVFATELRVFFLCCVILAGIYGALSVNRLIFWVQAFPAMIAISIVALN